MSLVKWSFIGLVGLPAAEVVAFLGVAGAIGWLAATCLLLATSFAGFLLLQRFPRQIEGLRTAVREVGLGALHLDSPAVASMLAAILLVLPGFVTDVLGVMLLVPPIRSATRQWLGRRRRARQRAQDDVVDLTRQEWRQIAERPLPRRRPRKDPA